jgi:uncharacterized membrane protein YdbT with pleckstrin-like domain
MRLSMTLGALSFLAVGLLFALLLASEEGRRAGEITTWVVLIVDAAWFVPGLFLAAAYYRSLKYEIQDDEVIVHVGIWTRSVKHVPFRTITNLKVHRGIFDRWFFDLGNLNIQTAGMSGTSGAEESLVGLPNFQEAYEIVSTRLRRYRGSMAPTAAEEQIEPKGDAVEAILTELRAIRKAVEK